ncbi:MAG: hypothetical protein KGL39_20335 [Patescibacteria group bacterium]|nr:hypothetical protein [Patescibacteria group bacterium]
MPVLSAAEADQIIKAEQRVRNSVILPPTLKRIIDMQQSTTFRVCNVGPWPYQLERGSLSIFLPGFDAKKHPKGYAESQSIPCIMREARLVGGGGTEPQEYSFIEDDGRAVAMDLIGVGPGIHPRNDKRQYGVFVPEGEEPTKLEIAGAKQRLVQYQNALIAEAREAFDKGREHIGALLAADVEGRYTWAANERGVDEPWVHHRHTQESVKCQNCGKYNSEGIAQCQCGHVINETLYIENQTRKARLDRQIQESLKSKN